MKILEQVIDAMIEGSHHTALKKTLVDFFFADRPDMAECRQRRLEHKRNDEKKRKTMVDETAPATPPPEPEPKLELEADVVVECPATPQLQETRSIVRHRRALHDMVDLSDSGAQFLFQT